MLSPRTAPSQEKNRSYVNDMSPRPASTDATISSDSPGRGGTKRLEREDNRDRYDAVVADPGLEMIHGLGEIHDKNPLPAGDVPWESCNPLSREEPFVSNSPTVTRQASGCEERDASAERFLRAETRRLANAAGRLIS
jgi:hypothetical protein